MKEEIKALIEKEGFAAFYKTLEAVAEEGGHQISPGVNMNGLRRRLVRNYNRLVHNYKELRKELGDSLYSVRDEMDAIKDSIEEVRTGVVGSIVVRNTLWESFDWIEDMEVDSVEEEEGGQDE